MKLSTRGRYGTRALLDLTLQGGSTPISLRDISQRQQIPLHYLEHLIKPLIAGGLIRSMRGPRGGILLAKPPEKIRLDEIIHLLEGTATYAECIDDPGICPRSETCATRDVWSEMETAINGVLGNITLLDLAERQKNKEQIKELMYYI